MKCLNVRILLNAAALTGGSILGANAWAQPSQGNYGSGSNGMGPGMMGNYFGFGWMGGYGGIWAPILLVAVVVGVVVWVVAQKKK